jgi:methylenetetrahydrofolate--tRNA-(uracil-5-)-methyltransferase
MSENAKIKVIGAGLAGCEAAWQAAKQGVLVELYEMKPKKFTPAHHNPGFAELVCSNSLRSNQLNNAVGLLKAELSKMGSLIMEAAYATEVPAGSALAVNRELFSEYITDKIKTHPNITVYEEEVTEIDTDSITVIATGPLTSERISESIADMTGGGELHFFDAAAPIIDFSTVDMNKAFFASRYGKGSPEDYLNCPMTREEYDAFYTALVNAETAPLKAFDRELQEDIKVFEGCMPVEVIASRGYDTLRFGPMKPVGLPTPETGEDAFATVQLRRENIEGTMYNIVGFQTHLTFPEQKRVFRMIPGLENAEFFRYGVMHRNTYINSPGFLTAAYSTVKNPKVFFAGQMTGVEGYVESVSSGFVAGVNAARLLLGSPAVIFPRETEIGALAHYVSEGGTGSSFQPMNANFGIIAPFDKKIKGGKKNRNEAYSARSLAIIDSDYSFFSEK